MKQKFTLLEVLPAQAQTAGAASAGDSATALVKLLSTCTAAGVARLEVTGGSTVLPSGIDHESVVLIVGSVQPEQLRLLCLFARQNGHHVIVVTDALECSDGDIGPMLVELNDMLFQLMPAAAARSLLTGKAKFIYPFPKVDCTATVAIFLDGFQSVVVITREHDPYMGMLALPGGFLNVQIEDLPACAARETKEEISVTVDPADLVLVDVRSSPSRDNRGHVVDHGYMWLVPADKKERVLAELAARSDALTVEAKPVAEVLASGLAFDHGELVKAALKQLP